MNQKESKIYFLQLCETALSIISSIIPVLSAIFSIVNKKYVYLIITGITLIVAIVIFSFKEKIARKILVFFMNKTAPKKSYKLISKKLEYDYISMEEMRFKNTSKVKPLRDGLDSINFRYKWTGSSNNLKPKTTNSNYTIKKIDTKFGYQRCKINFGGKVFNKNDDPIPVSIVFNSMKDTKKKASPHLSTGIYEQTDEVILQVTFPKEMNINNIRKLEFIHYTDEEHSHCIKEDTPKIVDDKKVITYKIKSPIYGGKYMIDWEFC